MTFHQIFSTRNRYTILIRGAFGIGIGLLLAAIWSIVTGMNEFRSLAFPIFGVPIILTAFNLLIFKRDKNE